MTATPIPRTLGQVLYADLDVSDLRTPPEGRIPIRTGHPPAGRARRDVAEGPRRRRPPGHRTFVVVPLIDEAEARRRRRGRADGFFDASAPAAEAEAVRLRELLAPLRVGLVHGRMKAADRDAEMARFRDGELDVLVGTTVVEVGVDVPEATMMIVEGADRFGLAQLHQLRGRVGRGDGRVVLRPRLRLDRRDGAGAAQGRRRDPRRVRARRDATSSSAARATCWASSRAACRACASRRSRTATHVALASARASHAEALLDEARRASGSRPRRSCRELERGLARARLGRRAGERRRDRRWPTPDG